MHHEEFLGTAIAHMVEHGISIRLDNTSIVKSGGMSFGGWFDFNNKSMRVGTGRHHNEWFPIFVHEYAHFLQSLDGFAAKYPDYYWSDFFDWMAGTKKLSQAQLRKYVKVIQYVEYDAERRVLKMIKKHKLDIDVVKYTKEANAYILSYTVLRKHRKWDNKSFASRVPELVEIMPPKLLKTWCKLPAGFESTMVEKCFKA
jgi:hypothetical protein